MSSTEAAWDNYWQGRTDQGQSALTGVEQDKELQAFWSRELDKCPRSGAFLDLACGAGTVLKIAQSLGFADLTGCDVSPAAIDQVSAAFPSAKGVVSSATSTPFEAESFDLIASQFGYEYADPIATAPEIGRLLKPHGRFIAVCHMLDGAIANEVRGHLSVAKGIGATGFIDRSKDLFRALQTGDGSARDAAIAALGPARDALAQLATQTKSGLAQHLATGAAQLWARRANYRLEDILGWFDGMENERAAFEMRMQDMLSAALSSDAATEVAIALQSCGLEASTPEALALGGAPAAWVIEATKRA